MLYSNKAQDVLCPQKRKRKCFPFLERQFQTLILALASPFDVSFWARKLQRNNVGRSWKITFFAAMNMKTELLAQGNDSGNDLELK